jgi:hypothetical protein
MNLTQREVLLVGAPSRVSVIFHGARLFRLD